MIIGHLYSTLQLHTCKFITTLHLTYILSLQMGMTLQMSIQMQGNT